MYSFLWYICATVLVPNRFAYGFFTGDLGAKDDVKPLQFR